MDLEKSMIAKAKTDIDIDVKCRDDVIGIIPHIQAVEKISTDGLVKHKTGVYLHQIPVDPVTGFASIQYDEAEDLGYQKIDLLNVSAYEHVRDRSHLIELANKEPNWDWFQVPELVSQLFQLKNYGTLLHVWKPTSIDELAMFLAFIRPAKHHLQNCASWDEVAKSVWDRSAIKPGEYYYKKAHAYSYALLIVVQLNSLVEFIISSGSV